MANLKFTPHLKRFFPNLTTLDIEADTIAEVIAIADKQWEGIANYIVDEQGALRKHVNIYVDGDLIYDKETLSDKVSQNSQIFVMQALSGG
ncbi:MAG: hypothetical protein Phog2KO_36990 [Phototrophicaceae bacterium]